MSETVRRNPYSVVLLDEIEKAHPEVFNVLLQILDDGRVTDGQGRTVDFRNTVLIMTSNIGGELLTGQENPEQQEAGVMEALRSHFRPEFLNRVDETVIFQSLGRKELQRIVRLQLDRVEERLARKGLRMRVSKASEEFLADEGYDPVYGARPLKRAIQKHLLDPLSLQVIEGLFSEGDEIEVEMRDGKMICHQAAEKAA